LEGDYPQLFKAICTPTFARKCPENRKTSKSGELLSLIKTQNVRVHRLRQVASQVHRQRQVVSQVHRLREVVSQVHRLRQSVSQVHRLREVVSQVHRLRQVVSQVHRLRQFVSQEAVRTSYKTFPVTNDINCSLLTQSATLTSVCLCTM